MKISQLGDKKILILGLGKEGLDTLKFLRELFPKKELAIADRLLLEKLDPEAKEKIKADPRLKLYLGKDYLDYLDQFEVIIKSPGVPHHLPQLKKADQKKTIITSLTRIFFTNCPGKIVGVTGTKGKSTATTLVYQVLKEGGLKTHLAGNIGKPPLSLLSKAVPDDIFVYELSSHQLFDLEISPQIAVLLNIFPEHLDYYQNFEEYIQAKANITQYQTFQEFLIFNWESELVKKIAQTTKAQAIPFSLKTKLVSGCFVQDEKVVYKTENREEKIISAQEIPLEGNFNLQNVMPAIIVGKLFNLSNSKIKKTIKSFKPLAHRLEKVGTFQGITFYNDALSTIPQAAIEAIESFKGRVGSLILGGFERHQDFKDLAQAIWKNKVKVIILFPTTGQRIWEEIKSSQLNNQPLPKHLFTKDTKEAVKFAYENTPKGKICLLSPASSSFSVFKDYQERGNLFKKWVRELAKNAA